MSPTAAPADITDSIAQLDARLSRIEASVSRLTEVLEQASPLVAMTGDVVDEEIGRLQARGVDVDARLRLALDLTEQITRPEALTALQTLTEQAVRFDETMGMLMDMADDLVAGLATEEQDAEARLAELARLGKRLTDPRTVRLAHKVLDRSENLEQLMDVALAAPDTLGMMMDSVDEVLAGAEAEGIDLGTLMERLTQSAIRAIRLAGSDELQELVDSYVLDPAALNVVSQAANAMVEVRAEPPGKAGLFKALGALSDPQVQTALDFAIRFGRRFGGSIQTPRQLPDHS